MLTGKTGLPQESELILCKVTRVQHNAVFVSLSQYEGKSGMLHISEISPGRIRNIRDFVTEGKTIVCKVLSVDTRKGHIDVSLRRVSESQRQQFNNSLKQQLTAEKIVEALAKDKQLNAKELFEKLQESVEEPSVFLAFQGFASGTSEIPKIGLKKPDYDYLLELIKQRIKPPRVEITGKCTITTYANDGAQILRDAFTQACAVDTEHCLITYGGNGIYNIRIEHDNFKQAESILKNVMDVLEPFFKDKKDAVFDFKKADGKAI